MTTRIACVAALLAVARALEAQSPLTVHLPDGKGAVSIAAADLRALPSDTVRFQPHHGESTLYRAATLASVLEKAGAPPSGMRVGRQAWVVLAEASDGYVVTFSGAELDPQLGPTRAWLAWESNGKELPAGEGPYRLLVPSDLRPPRSAHQIVRLRVLNVLTP